MKYNISDNSEYSYASIVDTQAQTVISYISADIHEGQTARSRAVELLYTDMLISGAGKYTRVEFLDAINSLGATVTASISDGIFTLFVRGSSLTFKKVLPLVETMIREPHFDKQELKRVKQTVINLLNESKENTRAIAHEQLRNTFYGTQDRRYTFKEESLIAEIATVTSKDLKTLHKKIISQKWTCSAASNSLAIAALKKSIQKMHSKDTTSSLFPIHQQTPPRPGITLTEIKSKQNIDFSIGAPVPITLHHPEYVALRFALEILGGHGFASRLLSTVREKEGLTYGIYSTAETFMNEEQGYWRIASFFSPDKSLQGLTSTFREIKKLYKNGITKEELARQKTFHHTKQALIGDSTSRRLNELHTYHLQKFSLEEISEHKQMALKITVEEVNTAIAHYLDPTLLTVSAAGPVGTVRKELQTFMKTVA